jgi:ArsR family transcriptional regulator
MEQVARTHSGADRQDEDRPTTRRAGRTTRVRPEVLRVVADPVALQALTVLSRESLCACHLASPDDPDAPVAERLGDLAAAGLVETERFEGELYYRVRSDALGPVRPLMPWLGDCTDDPPHRPCC